MALITTLLYIVFVLAAMILIVVILLQEGKGGGFGDALGVAGQQTFGVKASGIHRFTAVVALVFLCSALGIHVLNRKTSGASSLGDQSSLPADGSGAGIPLPGGIPLGSK
ncbi:MAG: preprotein translocase subunit SecG [Planctomycetota bacterium]